MNKKLNNSLPPPSVDRAEISVGLRGFVYAKLLAIVGDAAEAEDLTQETLLKVHRGLPTFRGESSLEHWVLRIAENVARDRYRRRARQPKADPSTGEQSAEQIRDTAILPAEEVDRRLSADCIRNSLETLPDPYRQALELHDFEELENPEISRRLGLPLSTVKIRVHRGRRQLKEACERDCEPYADDRGGIGCQPKKDRSG